MWRNFPMIRNKRWVKDNMVLLGDAKATAHFSIGSGHQARDGGRDRAGRRDGRTRRPSPARLQRLRARPPRGGREDPARRRRLAGLVRACRPLLGFRSRAVRLRRDDALQGDHLRQSDAARAGFRRARSTSRLRRQVARAGLRRRCRQSRWRRCSSRSGCARWCSPTASWCRRCACTRRRRACRAISIWCITARAPSAAPG